MNIKILKVVTGEELVADVKSDEGDSYVLKNPTQIVHSHEGVGLMNYSIFAKSKEITIAKDHVVWVAEVEEQMYNAYNGQYGNGIVLAGADVNTNSKFELNI